MPSSQDTEKEDLERIEPTDHEDGLNIDEVMEVYTEESGAEDYLMEVSQQKI